MPTVSIAASDEQIARCHPVMHQLRPHVPLEGFVERVRGMQRTGYHLAFLEYEGEVRAVAGYRFLDQFAAGRVLYVDDLVTDDGTRSHGHGAALLAWLRERAVEDGCERLELDSGVQRADAHRFYFRHRLTIVGYHFRSGPLRE